jgi:hypothetical protein
MRALRQAQLHFVDLPFGKLLEWTIGQAVKMIGLSRRQTGYNLTDLLRISLTVPGRRQR